MNGKEVETVINKKNRYHEASLTVEAAFVLPIFLYFMLAFLYFIQIFTVQEQIQSSISKMGLNLAKSAYILKDFPSMDEALSFDFSVFGEDFDISLANLADELASQRVLKGYAKKYLNTNQINHSCIKGGFDGISFYNSSLLSGEDYIDIVVSYQVQIPIKIFIIKDIEMTQRVKLRCWTGYVVEPAYQTESNNKDETVFIAATGSVYHKSETCSHIKLSVREVQGIPTGLKNDNGGLYKPCEACCTGSVAMQGTYFITSDGTRYHTRRDCSKIKRSVTEISLSEVGNRTPCKRCYD